MSSIYEDVEELTNAYNDMAPEDASYPYAVFELRKISIDDECDKYMLEINVWDSYRTYSRSESIASDIEKKLHKQIVMNDSRCITFHEELKNREKDEDKSIKRIRLQFSLSVYEKEN